MKVVDMTTSLDELHERLNNSNPYWAGRHADYAGLVQHRRDVLASLAQALGSEPAVYLQVAFVKLEGETRSIRAVALTNKLIITVECSDSPSGAVHAEVRSRRDIKQISIQPAGSAGRPVFSLRYIKPDTIVVLGGEQQTEANHRDLEALYPDLIADLA